MINIEKIKRYITESTEVILTAHKHIDLDAISSILGLYYITNNIGKTAYIIIEDEEYEPEIKRALDTIENIDKIVPTTYGNIKKNLGENPLLIITDTNKGNRIQNIDLLNIPNKIVIDHHVKTNDTIPNLKYEYVDVDVSSSTEIIMNLINELNVYVPEGIATIMLSGIYIDTNGFIIKTNANTHICASKLYEFKADSKEAQYLLKQNFSEYERRQKLIRKTEFYDNIAITCIESKIYSNIELAKASDVLLTFNNVDVAFAIAKLDKDTVGISARSLGSVDVSKIMAKFNGGGHKTDAAAQIKNTNALSIKEQLLNYMRGI